MEHWKNNAAIKDPLLDIAIQEAGPMRAIILGIIAALTVVLAVCVYLAVFRPL
jgi:hypothetical protein